MLCLHSRCHRALFPLILGYLMLAKFELPSGMWNITHLDEFFGNPNLSAFEKR